ncbi:hypothetical protein LTR36_007824 [Oleoguttula mirabilis]|uniref:Uncharacterized protein n=1 Tax=Oleoguttula mirabilis TaxID=1507867 RepID=A0AAV9JA58_9PEZI|nr:hypothetical protein LTR36_007824 [Oleoguttula mirabilis]
MLRGYGKLISSLSIRPSLRNASTAVTPKPRGRPSKTKTSDANLETVGKKGGEQDATENTKPRGLSEIQARLEATGYSRRRNAATLKPKTDAAPKTTTKAKATRKRKPAAVAQDPPSSIETPKRRPKKPETLPPRLLPPTSQKHHDLASFLAYASKASLNPNSTVYRGTQFEYTVAHTLRSLDFMLQRTGRSNDLGIDLVGHWMLPAQTPHSHTMPVIIQCKAAKTTPAMVRELEGAYAGAPAGWRGEGVLGMLVSIQHTTKGVAEAVQRSRLPLAVMQVTREGTVKQFIWNAVAAQAGLEGLGVAVRYAPEGARAVDQGSGTVAPVGQTIVLTWMGELWRPVQKRRADGVAAPITPPAMPESVEYATV